MKPLIRLIVLLILSWLQMGMAQTDSSRVFTFDQNLNHVPVLDSSLINLHHTYGAPNPFRFSSLGNLGLPTYLNQFVADNLLGFSILPNVYAQSEYTSKAITLTDAYKPHTDLLFAFGAKKESTFGYDHIQNFGRYLSLNSSLRTARTEAFYRNQTPHYINFKTALRFTSRNRKFSSVAQVVTNRNVHKENGGVDTASIYVQGVKANTEVVGTPLSNASMSKYNNAFSLLSYWHLNPADSIKDSSLVLQHIGTKHFYHRFDFKEEWFRFADSNEVFTPKPDTDGTVEPLRIFTYDHTYQNTLGFLLNREKEMGLKFLTLAINHQYIYVNQTMHKSHFNNVQCSADANFQFSNWLLDFTSNYFLAGYNTHDFQAKLSFGRLFTVQKERWYVQLYHLQQRSEPMYQYAFANSNRFEWNNNGLQKIAVSETGVEARDKRLSIRISYSSILNYCFINQQLESEQIATTQKLLAIHAKRRFTIHKFNITPALFYQKNSASIDVLRLPELGANLQAYFEGYLFKHATLSQAGVEMTYVKGYHANAYAPLLNQFYLQDSVFTANYPQLDLFVNLKVQSVRVCLKVSNALDGFYPKKVYTTVPGYPMYGRIIRLGVIWRFLD